MHFRVNGEVYRFATVATMERFMREPQLWCGLLRDPVTGNRFHPSTRSPERYFVGGPYFFETDSTAALFEADPMRYHVVRAL
jgi:YHS domain-containing protein